MKRNLLLIMAVLCCSFSAFAITLTQLPDNDLLRVVSEKLNTQWSDKNKSCCGMTKVRAYQAKGNFSDINEVARKILIESYGNEIDSKTEVKINSKNIEEADMGLVINDLMESSNYDSNSIDQKIAFTKNLQQLLNNLEVNNNTLIIIAEAKTDVCHPDQKVKSIFFYKAESEKAFQVFTAQGH